MAGFLVAMALSSDVSSADPVTLHQYSSSDTFNAAGGTTTTERFGEIVCLGLAPTQNATTRSPCLGDTRVSPGVSFLDTFSVRGQPSPLTVVFDTPVSAVGFDTNFIMGTGFGLELFGADGSLPLP